MNTSLENYSGAETLIFISPTTLELIVRWDQSGHGIVSCLTVTYPLEDRCGKLSSFVKMLSVFRVSIAEPRTITRSRASRNRALDQLHRLHSGMQVIGVRFVYVPHVALVAGAVPVVRAAFAPAVEDSFETGVGNPNDRA